MQWKCMRGRGIAVGWGLNALLNFFLVDEEFSIEVYGVVKEEALVSFNDLVLTRRQQLLLGKH